MCEVLLGRLQRERCCRQRAGHRQGPQGVEVRERSGVTWTARVDAACAAGQNVRGDGAAPAGRVESGRGLRCFVRECGLDLPIRGFQIWVCGDRALH